MDPFSPEDFQRETGVSRETLDRLRVYEALLRRWQPRINLVSSSTLADVWRRHLLDSAQFLALAPASARRWLDLGSGAGFPGLVLAILGAREVHLVESDHRKAAFLAEVARATGASNAVFHVKRIEQLEPQDLPKPMDVVTARALASPEKVIAWAEPWAPTDTTYLLPVGRVGVDALTQARKTWNMSVEALPSRTDSASQILRIRGVSRG